MSLKKDFLWGGAVAAHQLEGAYNVAGKGVSIMDVSTGGTKDTPRRITNGIVEGEYYPNHEAIDFITTIKKISQCLRKWVLNVSVHLLHGQEFIQPV